MNEKNLIKIPIEIKHLFNQEYLDFDLALKLLKSDNPEVKNFFEKLMPLVKEFIKKEFPIINMLNIF